MEFNIDDILLDASYKHNKGYIDVSKNEDILFLKSILIEMQYPHDFIDEYIDNLLNKSTNIN